MAAHEVKEGDTEPMTAVLSRDGAPADLSEVEGITFAMVQREGGRTVSGDATVSDAAAGLVAYAWEEDDLDTPGWYDGEFQVTYSNGNVLTFPSGYLQINVVAQLV